MPHLAETNSTITHNSPRLALQHGDRTSRTPREKPNTHVYANAAALSRPTMTPSVTDHNPVRAARRRLHHGRQLPRVPLAFRELHHVHREQTTTGCGSSSTSGGGAGSERLGGTVAPPPVAVVVPQRCRQVPVAVEAGPLPNRIPTVVQGRRKGRG